MNLQKAAGAGPARPMFRVGRIPKSKTRLPFVLEMPVAGEPPLVFACAVDWPFGKDAYCHPVEAWPSEAELVDEIPVERCWRSGKAVHLLLARRQRRRSMFLWTEARGRTAVFWRTQATVSAARPGLKVPQARGLDARLPVAVDLREQYPWHFKKQKAATSRRELPVGDYGVFHGKELWGVVERKTPANLSADAVGGKLAFSLAELEQVPYACLVVEGRLSDVLKAPEGNVDVGWLMSVLAALQVEHPGVPWIFAETRALAEDYAFRWLSAAVKRRSPPGRSAALGASPASGRSRPSSELKETPPQAYQLPLEVNDRAARLDKAIELARGGLVWTSAEYAERFRVSRSTAWNELRMLVASGSLVAEGSRRGRRYRSP